MKLAEYLTKQKMRPSAFAASIDVPPSTVSRWMTGARTPRADAISKIQRKTKGKVTIRDFLSEPASNAVGQ